MTVPPSIEVKNLCASYGNNIVFENLSFSLQPFSFTALCGPNGAGKSTLLSLLDGIVPAGLSVSGQILVNGQNVLNMNRAQIAKNISYLVQSEKPVWNFKVSDFIETGLYAFETLSKVQRIESVSKVAALLSIENLLDKNVFNISGGEFQKCRLARCFVSNSNILLMDEPAENLDLPYQMKFLELIKRTQKNNTVLFSIHDINMAALFADNFILFSEKNVLTGNAEKIFDEAVLSKAYNAQARIFLHPEFSKPQVCF